jgi:glycosyltransferase involved in cell wall biosynthesis
MAVGTPVVYCESSENAIAGLVRDGIEGICTHPDPVSLASGIERLLDDTEFWTRLSENAKKRAKSYDWANIAQQIEVLFHRAIQ